MNIDLAKIDFAPGQGGGGKIETDWSVSTVTENGTYTYSASAIGPNYTLNSVTVPVDVPSKPEETLVETITTNGSFSYAPQDGYVFDRAEVTVDIQGGPKQEETFDVNPSTSDQNVVPSSGSVFSGGVVRAVTSSIDNNITSGNIKNGVTILGVTGNYNGGQAGDGTWMNPYTVSEAISAGPSNDVYVKGEVVSVSQNYTSSYGLATYDIRDDLGSTMTVYRSYYFNNKRAYEFPPFCVRDLVPGDEVIVYGDTGWYGSIFEFMPATSSCLFMLNGWRPEPDENEELVIQSNGTYNVAYYGSLTAVVHPSTSLSETYTSNGTYNISGEFNGGQVTVDVQGGPKPEESLAETITSNGSYSYSPQPGYVYDSVSLTVDVQGGPKPEETLNALFTTNDLYELTPQPGYVYDKARITVDVHPSTSLSETYTSNGTYNISGDFNGGTIVVSVSGGGGSTDQFIYRNGSVDDSGLTDIGWTQNDINYYRYNSPHYSWRNSEYIVSQTDKDLYGVIDASNKDTYKYIVQYLPVYDMSGVTSYNQYFSDFKKLRAIPFISLSSYTGSCRYMFRRCYELETIPPLDFSGCTSIANLFEDCYSLVSVPSPLECSRLTTLASMFKNCRSLVEVPQLVTGNLQYVDNFCQGCSSLKYVPGLDLMNVRRTRYMFDGCLSLEEFSFRTDTYEIEPGTFMTLYALPLDTDLTAMFRNCKLLDFEYRPGFYVSSSATKFSFMFEGCETMLHSPYMNYIGGEVMQMFMGCNTLQTFDNVYTLGDFTNCKQMFAACEGLLHINKSLPTSLCTAAQMSEMFRRCYFLKNIAGIDFSSCDGDPDLFGDDTGDLNYLTSVTVNGSINVSFPVTFSRCIALDRSSVLSILTAMSNANNADPKDMVFNVSVEDGQDLQDLLTACTAKGWNITGLTVVPVV